MKAIFHTNSTKTFTIKYYNGFDKSKHDKATFLLASADVFCAQPNGREQAPTDFSSLSGWSKASFGALIFSTYNKNTAKEREKLERNGCYAGSILSDGRRVNITMASPAPEQLTVSVVVIIIHEQEITL